MTGFLRRDAAGPPPAKAIGIWPQTPFRGLLSSTSTPRGVNVIGVRRVREVDLRRLQASPR